MSCAGQAQVILTDHDVKALEMAKLNVDLNNLAHCVQVLPKINGNEALLIPPPYLLAGHCEIMTPLFTFCR